MDGAELGNNVDNVDKNKNAGNLNEETNCLVDKPPLEETQSVDERMERLNRVFII